MQALQAWTQSFSASITVWNLFSWIFLLAEVGIISLGYSVLTPRYIRLLLYKCKGFYGSRVVKNP
jgi:hypothetical protein